MQGEVCKKVIGFQFFFSVVVRKGVMIGDNIGSVINQGGLFKFWYLGILLGLVLQVCSICMIDFSCLDFSIFKS